MQGPLKSNLSIDGVTVLEEIKMNEMKMNLFGYIKQLLFLFCTKHGLEHGFLGQ